MVRYFYALATALTICIAVVTGAGAQAQHAEEYAPSVGQPGKDVVWVPTPEALVEHMLKMAKVTPKDFVMDLGSGDGRIAIAAAKDFGARATGIEYNPQMVELSKRNAKAAGVASKVKFVKADLFETDLSKADVITMYLLPRINLQLRPKLLSLKPGTRIVSHAFDLGDWKSDDDAVIEGREAYLWIVPAKIGGNWHVSFPDDAASEPIDLALTQNYQLFWGQAKRGDQTTDLAKPWLSGAKLRFTVPEPDGGGMREYTGEVNGKRMQGTVTGGDGTPRKWLATRSR
jgi:SAM-dependent methyltransferase